MRHTIILLLISFLTMPLAWCGPRQYAFQLHQRIVGVKPSKAVLDQMEQMIATDRAEDAINLAMENPLFYNLRLKQWFKTWSNVESSNRVPLNDLVATAIGLVRDDEPFNRILFDDILYVAGNTAPADLAPYAANNNDHYRQIEERRLNLAQVLVPAGQSGLNGISDSAGVLTSRAYGEAFYSAGTNRRVTRYTFINFLCHDFESLHDITTPDFRVRRDVDRKPGGDSRVFKSKCVGCHAGQDALGGAWSYFDFVGGALVYTPATVVPKINKNNLFSDGHVTMDDGWLNLWATGQNAYLGFRGPIVGNGARQMGTMLANSQAFSQCMVKRAYKLLCLQEPASNIGNLTVAQLATQFENNQYSMKYLLQQTALRCPSDEMGGQQ